VLMKVFEIKSRHGTGETAVTLAERVEPWRWRTARLDRDCNHDVHSDFPSSSNHLAQFNKYGVGSKYSNTYTGNRILLVNEIRVNGEFHVAPKITWVILLAWLLGT